MRMIRSLARKWLEHVRRTLIEEMLTRTEASALSRETFCIVLCASQQGPPVLTQADVNILTRLFHRFANWATQLLTHENLCGGQLLRLEGSFFSLSLLAPVVPSLASVRLKALR